MNEIIFSGQVNGISLERADRSPEFIMHTRHFHREFEIYYLLRGTRYYFINDKTYHVKKGDIVFIDSNQIHKTGETQTAPHERMLIMLHEKSVLSLEKYLNSFTIADFFQNHSGVLTLSAGEQNFVEQLLLQMQNEMKQRLPHYENIVTMAVVQLLLLSDRCLKQKTAISATITPQTNKHEKVNQVAQYITKNYDTPITLAILEKECFMSKYYLCRIFKEVTGLSVIEYLNLIRVQQAQKLLENSSDSITTIAHAVGFESITYFERIFKKCLLQTPMGYRAAYRNDSIS